MKPWQTAKPRFFFMKPLQRKSGNKKALGGEAALGFGKALLVPDEIHQVGGILAVVNRERGIESNLLGVFAQQVGRADEAQVHDLDRGLGEVMAVSRLWTSWNASKAPARAATSSAIREDPPVARSPGRRSEDRRGARTSPGRDRCRRPRSVRREFLRHGVEIGVDA